MATKQMGSSLSDCNHNSIKFQSILRIRPFQKKEDDCVVLEPSFRSAINEDFSSVVLHPMISTPEPESEESINNSSTKLSSSDSSLEYSFVQSSTDLEYHLDHVFPVAADQEKVFYAVGLPIATSSLKPLRKDLSSSPKSSRKTHFVLCMGAENSGKTHTCFGKD